MADRPPGHGGFAEMGVEHLFDFPDTEKAGLVEDGWRKNALDPPLDAFDGIPVKNTDKYAVFRHPAGLFNRFERCFHEFERGDEDRIIE